MTTDFTEIPDPGGRYEVCHLLGCGVFGKVHLAKDVEAGKKNVAIKIQKYESETEQYIEEEYKILRDISNHANIVDFYGVYKKDGDIWFVLELCEGGPVTRLVNGLLAKNRRMVEEHIAYILKEVTKAVIYLHENDVIHRDIKGSNILLTREGEVKLSDFGISQKLTSNDQKLSTRIGSPCWMAPELVAANENKKDATYDNRIDVWALGITAIELGEGKAPFQDIHPTRALFQIVTNPPPYLQKVSNWSEYYHDFISECLVKFCEYRPYIMEVIDHPFLEQVPENNYHLSLELKSLLMNVNNCDSDQLDKTIEVIINENLMKKGIEGDFEPMFEEDLAALSSITEKSVLKLLEDRLQTGECYSFIGDILLYLNPNEERGIYGKEFHEKYSFKSRSENAPHIYSVGDTAYQNALHHVTPQQVIFLGESSSGKTTNYLHLLDHLLYLGDNPSISSNRIKNAVKLIHSLIHACSPSNENSTRAIFKTSISFGKTGKFTGASFKVLGLEKWRVSSIDATQSNFHFLYYIYDGLVSEDLAEKYKLDPDREYRYLKPNEASKTLHPKETNIKKFRKIVEYLEELRFSDEEMSTIYSVAAAILNLGEIKFTENEDGFAELESKEPVKNFAELLEVENKKICWTLTNYCLVDAGRAIRKRNSCHEARDTRDVLANNLYTRLVDYIVNIINRNLSLGKEIFGEKYSIRILDYFGFECFKRNNLAQFFVNTFNEQLHYHYLQRIFAWETWDLINEEVEYTPISYFNNKDTLNELLGKPEGVLSIIDDASMKGYSGRYIIDNIQNQEKSTVIASNAFEFSVAHYTGTVSYDVRDIPEKNRDFLVPEIIDTMRNSQNPAVSMLFTNKLDKCGNLYIPLEPIRKTRYSFSKKLSSNNQFSQIKKMRTQATIFRAICLDLLKELSIGSGSGGTHFVKCIRTDLNRKPLTLQKELVRQQIRALNVVETAKSRQRGYPHRMSFSEFLKRYKFLAFSFDENVELTRDNCRLLMVRLKMEGWCLGKTKIFLKYYNEEYLSRLYETQVKKIIKIQSILRRFLAKCKLNKDIKDQEKECIQEIKRKRSSIMTEDEAAEIIQKAYRKSNSRKEASNMFEPLQEENFKFIEPFALKWKNKSIFSVLMRYRAVKLQDFFNFCQQVHLYNQSMFHYSQQIMENVDLNMVDRKATTSVWLGERIRPVLKIIFRLSDIPFYDTSNMHDLLTNLGNFEKQDSWDVPYQWRQSQSKKSSEVTDLPEILSKSDDLVNITYTRNPDDDLVELRSCSEEEEDTKHVKDIENENAKGKRSPDSADLKSDDENIETDDSVDTDGNPYYDINMERNALKKGVAPKNKNQTQKQQTDKPLFEKINLRKVDKSDNTKYIVNSKPANKDFDYIKATPIPAKSKLPADPIAELRNIARKDNNVGEDDPPFNFQGMLRKTNFRRDSLKNSAELARKESLKRITESMRRDSLKNAIEAVRRFSLSKEQGESVDVVVNGNEKEEPIVYRMVELEILPGLIMNGVEVDL